MKTKKNKKTPEKIVKNIEDFLLFFIKDPIKRQDRLIDLLLVVGGHRPACYFEDEIYNNPIFIHKLKAMKLFEIEIGPYYANGMTCVIINPLYYKWVLKKLKRIPTFTQMQTKKYTLIGEVLGYHCPGGKEFLNFDKQKLSIRYYFERNGITTYHLGSWCILDVSNKDVINSTKRLIKIQSDPLFAGISVYVKMEVEWP